MDKDTFVELFLLQVRGVLASAFMRSGVQPDADEIEMLRGTKDVTSRAIGEIAWRTGFDPHLSLIERREAQHER